MNAPRDGDAKRGWGGAEAVVFLALATFVMAWVIRASFSSDSAILSGAPILTDDFSVQYYWAWFIRDVFPRFHHFWAYDPYFMAGYPLGHIFNSSDFLELFAVVFGFFSAGAVVKLLYFLSVMLLPVVVYSSARLFGIGRDGALTAVPPAMIVFIFGLIAVMSEAGMIPAILLSYAFIVVPALFWYDLERRSTVSFILLIVVVPIILMIHKTAVVMTAPVTIGLIALRVRSLRGRDILKYGAVAAAIIAANWFWIGFLIRYWRFRTVLPDAPYWQDASFGAIFNRFLGVNWYSPTYLVRIVLTVFGSYGIVRLYRDGRRSLAVFFSLAALYFIALVYLGPYLPFMKTLNCYRYVDSIFLILVLPAVYPVSNFASGRTTVRYAFLAIVAMLLVIRPPSYFDMFKVHPLTDRLNPDLAGIARWITANTDGRSRILIEDSGSYDTEGYGHQYFQTHFPGMLPVLTSREFIGGPHPDYYITHHFAEFHSGKMFDKDVALIDPRSMREYMTAYNIGAAVVWSSMARERFDRQPDLFARAGSSGKFTFYRVKIAPSFVTGGSAIVHAGYNRIGVAFTGEPPKRTILKYHWLDTLVASGGVTIRKAKVLDDPIGFIEVDDPPQSFSITNGYGKK